jgi:hypothetical protein
MILHGSCFQKLSALSPFHAADATTFGISIRSCDCSKRS